MLERIGRYSLKRRIGAGGQATVYLAEDTLLQLEVAVKVMTQLASSNEEYSDTILQEARLATSLNHRNIAGVRDFIVENDYVCIVMELVPDSVDKQISSNGPYSQEKALDLLLQTAGAIEYAHSQGFVHRDIKPHNLLLTSDGEIKVADFGISRAVDLSVATGSMGTLPYMAPEQLDGEHQPDFRSDIYSLGVTFYEMLVGKPLFSGTFSQIYNMQLNGEVPDFDSSLGISDSVRNLLLKCLEKNPEDRFQKVSELIEEISEVSSSLKETPPSIQAAAPVASETLDPKEETTNTTFENTWRRLGAHTILGEITRKESSGMSNSVQAGPDEFVFVRKNGELDDVFTESRKPTRSFWESIRALIGFGPKIEVFKATRTRFNIIFWLGDDETLVTGNKSFTFGLPVLTKDNQVVSGKINLWLQVGDELPENLLLMLRGQQAINKFDIASEIRDDLLGKVLSLDINSYTYDELRGNRELLETIASSIRREISSSLSQFGLFVQDCSVSWGLNLEQSNEIEQQKHESAMQSMRNLNEIERLRNDNIRYETESSGPLDVILRPSRAARMVAFVSLLAAVIILGVNLSNMFDSGDQTKSSNTPFANSQLAVAPAVAPTAIPAAAPTAIPAAAPAAAASSGRSKGHVKLAVANIYSPNGLPRFCTAGCAETIYMSGITDVLFNAVSYDDKTVTTEPMAALSYELDHSLEFATFKLREGIQFHGGYGEMTAKDVEFSYNDANSVTNPESIHGQAGDFAPLIRSMEAVDDYTLKLNYRNYDPRGILHRFSSFWQTAGIVSTAVFAEHGVKGMQDVYVGIGPFENSEWSQNGKIVGTAFADYYGHVGPEKMTLLEVPESASRRAMLETGEVAIAQVATKDYPGLSDKGFVAEKGGMFNIIRDISMVGNYWETHNALTGAALERDRDTSLPWIGNPFENGDYDETTPSMVSSQKVREAFAWAIDREALVETLVAGLGVINYQPYLSINNPNYNSDWNFGYDMEGAKRHLVALGYADGFDMDLWVGTSAQGTEIGESIGANWQENLGIKLNLIKTAYSTYRPGLVARTNKTPGVNICGDENKSNFPYDWTHGFVKSSFSAGGYGVGQELPYATWSYSKMSGEPDKAVREELAAEFYANNKEWVNCIGLFEEPLWPYWDPNQIESWDMRPNANGNIGTINSINLVSMR